MRLKPVPEPPTDLDDLRAFQRAVPLVPGRTDDCCARLRRRCDLPDRQTANDWLAFLRALGLAEETPRGYVRTDAAPTKERVREGLRASVLHVPEAIEELRRGSADPTTESDPLTAEALFAATRGSVPRHDRARNPDWEAAWRERADRLLRWLALVDLAERVALPDGRTGYVAGDALASRGRDEA
ncbi:hypothetical protein GJ633_11620 [Halorubrum sp. CBA1125]|uniref:hypothetical protein n=1 Tax=Halorubrum sp. CBA1125 TaxID=2668072 RepID=UPI0012E77801|nr:hypothetical protein [Halorubrum sp. CBA1125]MUW15223.1 hypothetical protein [Halorubrum sp. CBA1125]